MSAPFLQVAPEAENGPRAESAPEAAPAAIGESGAARANRVGGASPADLARFFAKTKRVVSGCLEWTGALTRGGYGSFGFGPRGTSVLAHRFIYIALVGPIPEGLHTDHLCRNRRCVDISHLEPVTPRENMRRGQSPSAILFRNDCCVQGHELAGPNLYVKPDGRRCCRVCMRRFKRDAYRRKHPVVKRRPLAAYKGRLSDLVLHDPEASAHRASQVRAEIAAAGVAQ